MPYITVRGSGEAEVLIRKSRFIARVGPVRSDEEAWRFIQQVRDHHPDAAHHCFAFLAGSAARLSDDGEPSGTAGRPIFDVLEKQGLSDTVIVVTRYFGGILLGAGGLVRAYSQAAAAGVEAAGLAEAQVAVNLTIQLDYSLVGKVQHLLQRWGALTLESRFGEQVELACRLPLETAQGLEEQLAEVSAGRIQITRTGEVLTGADLMPIHGG